MEIICIRCRKPITFGAVFDSDQDRENPDPYHLGCYFGEACEKPKEPSPVRGDGD